MSPAAWALMVAIQNGPHSAVVNHRHNWPRRWNGQYVDHLQPTPLEQAIKEVATAPRNVRRL